MRAIILAAGCGRRMGVLAQGHPKCLIEVNGKTLLDWQIEALQAAVVDPIGIVRGYQGKTLNFRQAHFFENLRWNQTQMLRSLLCASEWLEKHTCLVSYSDIYYRQAIVKALAKAQGDIVIAYDPQWLNLWRERFGNPLEDAETFRCNSRGVLEEIGGKTDRLEDIQGQYLGLLKFTPVGWMRVSSFIQSQAPEDIDRMDMTSLLSHLLKMGVTIHTVPVNDFWYEIDSEKDLHLCRARLASEKMPLVSVLTPCYNSVKYIEGCIQSVLAQDYPNVEMIVQDGGSTDGTVEILKQYSGRVDWHSEKDAGQSDGLNRALQRCRGSVIGVLNADDEYLSDAASWAARFLAWYPETAVVYGKQYNVDRAGNIINVSEGPDRYDFSKILCCEKVIPAQAAFIRRYALERVGFYIDVSRSTCPDYELWVRLGLHFPMRYDSRFVARYRWHPGSEGQNVEKVQEMVRSKCEVVERVCKDPITPLTIRALHRRAISGIYFWSTSHFDMIGGRGSRSRILKALARSFLTRPGIRSLWVSLRYLVVFDDLNLNVWNSCLVSLRHVREGGRAIDRICFGGLFYRWLYTPVKKRIQSAVGGMRGSIKHCLLVKKRIQSAVGGMRGSIKHYLLRVSKIKRLRKEWNEALVWRRRTKVASGAAFHGDSFLVALAEFFLAQSRNFIETGTYLGSTAIYVAANHPQVQVYTCDTDEECVQFARSKSRGLSNIRIEYRSSPDFLREFFSLHSELQNQPVTCWIDSHWADYWPLEDEVQLLTQFIRKGFIVIDDFKVPHRPERRYDVYGDKECSFERIYNHLDPSKSYRVIYPNYSKAAVSPFWKEEEGLVGFCALAVGFGPDFQLPEHLKGAFRVVS